MNGVGTTKDDQLGIKLLDAAATQGDALAEDYKILGTLADTDMPCVAGGRCTDDFDTFAALW